VDLVKDIGGRLGHRGRRRRGLGVVAAGLDSVHDGAPVVHGSFTQPFCSVSHRMLSALVPRRKPTAEDSVRQ
jgi:hypothetical protein